VPTGHQRMHPSVCLPSPIRSSPSSSSPTSPSPTLVHTPVAPCRRPDQHQESHPEGAVSVPMYRLIDMGQADFAKVCLVTCGVVGTRLKQYALSPCSPATASGQQHPHWGAGLCCFYSSGRSSSSSCSCRCRSATAQEDTCRMQAVAVKAWLCGLASCTCYCSCANSHAERC
jgi:hypothetical protein